MDINFSRKREPEGPIKRRVAGNVVSVEKKHKKSMSDLGRVRNGNAGVLKAVSGNGTAAPAAESEAVGSMRPSRFQEGSMRDRPSNKPPSMYMRRVSGSNATEEVRKGSNEMSVDALMEEYLTTASTAEPPRRVGTQAIRMEQLSAHHAGSSNSSNSSMVAESGSGRESGLTRISKAINPKNIWSKYRTKEYVPRGYDGISHPPFKNHDQELIDQQVRVEQVYAKYKKSGAFHSTGARRASATNVGIPVSKYTQLQSNEAAAASVPDLDKPLPPAGAHFISLGDYEGDQPRRPRVSSPQRISAIPGAKAGSKFHIRSPSLQDLKRIASSGLHKRAVSHMNLSPVKQIDLGTDSVFDGEAERTRHSSSPIKSTQELVPGQHRSRKDLVKQARLNRRISDLESKLEMAKRQLEETIAAPPVPPVPQMTITHDSGVARNRRSQYEPEFEPLPTLFSESLLLPASTIAAQATETKESPAGPPVPPKSLTAQRMEVLSSEEDTDYESVLSSQAEEPEFKRFNSDPEKQPQRQPNDGPLTGSPRKLVRPRANIGPIPIANPAANNGQDIITVSDNPRSSLETLREETMSLKSFGNLTSVATARSAGYVPGSGTHIPRPGTSRGLPAGARQTSMPSIREQFGAQRGQVHQKMQLKAVKSSEVIEVYVARSNAKEAPPVTKSVPPRKKLVKKNLAQLEAVQPVRAVKATEDKPFEWPSDCF
jgi:hypothetical protein